MAKKNTTTTNTTDLSIFNKEVSPALIAQAIYVYTENTHRGVSKTKTRGEVDLTKHKVYKQKGTGNARHGAKSSPVYVGGGVAFGPTGHKTALKSLSKKMKSLALLGILSLYQKENRLSVMDVKNISSSKTKDVAKVLGSDKLALIQYQDSEDFIRAVGNISNVTLHSASRLNVFGVALAPKVVFTKNALAHLIKRLNLN